jgi:ornithine cyclodeaminase/alanine dehydrogenase-like protein (mu-crystallin family)
MLLLTRSDVKRLMSMNDALEAVESGFRALHAGEVLMPQRLALAIPGAGAGGLHLSMPAYTGGEAPALSVKIVTVFPDNPSQHTVPTIQGVVLLHDAATGAPLALMDAEELTALRTGAASGVATRWLAREDAANLLMIGAGALARTQIEAVCAVRSIRHVTVASASGKRDGEVCQWVREHLGIAAEPARALREAIATADIICTATNTDQPLFDGAWIKPGAHLNLVGAYTRRLREVDPITVTRARVIVDRLEAARTEAGDIVQAAEETGVAPESLIAGELGAVVAGALPARTDPDEITLFKSVGLAMQDVVCAARVYRSALAEGAGTHIDLAL